MHGVKFDKRKKVCQRLKEMRKRAVQCPYFFFFIGWADIWTGGWVIKMSAPGTGFDGTATFLSVFGCQG